jgi:hypothetical protein
MTGPAFCLKSAFFASVVALVGCSGESTPKGEPPVQNMALQELGEMYRMYTKETKNPPAAGKVLMKYANGFSHGSMAIQNKTIGVYWGARIAPGETSILAYEKDVPKTGGSVLLLDGETVKTLTSQEFAAATKAGS